MEQTGYKRLISQIDAFIRKYYKNRMVKGALLFVLFLGLSYLSVVLLEHFGRFDSTVRAVLFFVFLLISLFLLIRYLIIPIGKLFNFGKTINHEQASQIIGGHFPTVDDRLLNTLQLRNDYVSGTQSELLLASIEQRSTELSVMPFSSAINWNENKKYLIYLLPLLLAFGVIFISKPQIFSGSTERIVNYQNEYIPLAPFTFYIDQEKLEVVEGNNFSLNVSLSGNEFPEKLYVSSEEGRFVMVKKAKSEFSFEFLSVKSDVNFMISGNDFNSKKYLLHVLKKPEVSGLNVHLTYPKYLNKEKETIENAGDLSVPEGTNVVWEVFTKKADNAELKFKDTSFTRRELISDVVKFNKSMFNSQDYEIILSRSDNDIIDSTRFNLNVVKDKFPLISVVEDIDSSSNMNRFFSGSVSDDYGLSSLVFYYKIVNKEGKIRTDSKRVSINNRFNKSGFFHHLDMSQLGLVTEDKVSYYFVVKDNDAINNFKSTRSPIYYYQVPSNTDLADLNNEQKDDIKKDLDETIKKAADFKKKINKLKTSSLQKSNFDWKDMQQMNELMSEQESLEQDLLDLNQQIQNNQQQQEQFSELSKELLEKQELVNDLMESVMDQELKDLLKKLQEMMDNQQKQDFDEEMQNLEMDSKEMEEKLDNTLELLKRLEVEEKSDQIAKNLEELAKDQEDLSKKVGDKKISSEEAKSEQKKIEDKFKQVKDDVDRLMDKNNELRDPMKLQNQDELEKEIDEQMQESQESLEKNKGKKASDAQKKSSEKMEEMAQSMQQQMEQQQQEQAGEDMKAIRMLLENIITLSLDQELVMKSFDGLSKRNPSYVSLGKDQHRIKRDTRLVEDSLKALASRVPQIASFINDEMSGINSSLEASLREFEERKTAQMNVGQQRVMTGFNNLALLLNEALEQMQSAAQNQMPGSGSCNKPGGKGSKPSAGMSMKEMKEMLKKQMEQMNKGPNPGGKKPGDKPGQGNTPGGIGMTSMEISKMAREQAMMRKELKKLAQQLNKDGSGKGNGLNKAISDLEKIESDLVNRKFSPDMIKRQKDILTRLLESEKALREQEYDNKRKSKSTENKNNGNLLLLEQYKKRKQKEIELLKSVPPSLNEYYKNKANEYINVLDR